MISNIIRVKKGTICSEHFKIGYPDHHENLNGTDENENGHIKTFRHYTNIP